MDAGEQIEMPDDEDISDADNGDIVGGAAAARPVQPPAAPAAGLRIHDEGRWHFFTANRTDVGWLHHLGANSIKATCKLHKSCTCAISQPTDGSVRARELGGVPSFDAIAADLITWLDAGLDLTPTEHLDAATVLRRDKWKMRIRQKAD